MFDKPLKIMVMVHWYLPGHAGGAETMLHSLLRPLVERGHTVDVLEGWEPPTDRPGYLTEDHVLDGVNVHPHKDRNDPLPYLRDADLIITHLQQTERAVNLALWPKLPVIMLCHNDYSTTSHYLDPRYAYYLHPVYNSEWMKAKLEQPYNKPHPLGTIIRPAVVADDYRVTPGNRVTLVNLNEDKGSKLFWHLAESMKDTQFLAVVGAHGDQVIRRDLPNVEVVEHSPDMHAVYAKTRLLLMPSIYESWGRVGTEAMASGIPVLAHRTEGLQENLGEAGVFLDRSAPQEWMQAITRLKAPRAYSTASKRALKRSKELEAQRQTDMAHWVEYVEGARYRGR